ncbi:DUF2304 domain-containing protein [Planctomycetota bacterium]|nr:DUF2304 domain-containing protein [Planctomycetota bacterium]
MIETLIHPRTIILFGFSLILVLLTLRSLRAQRLKERYVLLFMLTGLPFIVLAFWPDGILFISDILEIEKATLLVLCSTMYFVLTTFALLSIVSIQERKLTTLSQMVGILMEKQQEQIDKDQDTENQD